MHFVNAPATRITNKKNNRRSPSRYDRWLLAWLFVCLLACFACLVAWLLAYICLSHLLHLGVDGGEELDCLAGLVGLDEVRAEVQQPLGDVVVKLEQVSVPQLENRRTKIVSYLHGEGGYRLLCRIK